MNASEQTPATHTPWLGAGAVLAASVIYYALYYDAGYNTADPGNYAQLAYELFLGRDPHTLSLSYGVLWFKIGDWLFQLFGPSYSVVTAVFFTAITATNVLVYMAILRLTGKLGVALGTTAIILLVPAFPATAFYGFCVAINAAAQARFVMCHRGAIWHDAALAGAALSVTFQLRPDFGFIFTVPLVLLLWGVMRDGALPARTVVLAVVGGGIAAHTPLVIAALVGGYADLIVAQYLAYPAIIVTHTAAGLASLFSSGGAAGGTTLDQPRLNELLSPFSQTGRVAVLFYAPLAGVAAYGVLSGLRGWRAWRTGDQQPLIKAAIILAAGAAALPHYVLYRPDLSHIANAMPGFAILSAVLFAQALKKRHRAEGARWFASAGGTALLLHGAFYTWVGLQSPATGSAAVAAGRTMSFEAENGVAVRLAPSEHALLSQVRDTIRSVASLGEAVVCLPYCPGIAFMTGQRMLLDRFYVDESTPLLDPDWVDRAIARTRAEEPPVVIIQDWAINGTEASRVDVWAAEYVAAVQALAHETIDFPGLTLYVMRPQPDSSETP